MPPPKLKIEKLNSWYTEADRLDKETFAEFRSNILLVAGEHYQKQASARKTSGRGPTGGSEPQKLRLVKNFMHKVARRYRRAILAYAPGTTILPQKDTELQDQKSAEMNLSVWDDAKARYKLRAHVRDWVRDFTDIGEVCVKIIWDPNKGPVKGYGPMVLDDGTEAVDPMTGDLLPDEDNPVFTGEFVFERVYAYNLLRFPWAKSMRESPGHIIRKLTDKEILEETFQGQPEKLKLLAETTEDDFIVFDGERGRYNREKKQVLVREFYWRPCRTYPEGYFAITTDSGILDEGPLPFGIYPVVWTGFDEHPGAARARSILRVARPFQAEINRSSSQQAMHSITVGDDKVLYQSGTKLASGALLPGVRGLTFQGVPPQILPGRDGSQFTAQIEQNIEGLFSAVDLEEINQEKEIGAVDPYTMLFAAINQQKKYAEYNEKFEDFLIEVTELYLNLARKYLDDDALIYAVGKREQVNIAEFRQTTPLCYSIKVEAQSETVEEMIGRQLTFNHILQYVGNRLEKDDIGKLAQQMPYGNWKEAFGDFTIDADNIKNDMLAMERGEQPPISDKDNHEYILKRLTKRMKEADYRFLAPDVQQLYEAKYAAHQQILEQQVAAIAAAKNEFVPVGGALIAADMYVPNEENPDAAPKRVRIPYQALDWLVKRLEEQGMTLDKMETMNQGMVADMADHILKGQGGNPAGPQLQAVGGQ